MNELGYFDILSLLGTVLGVLNYQENLSQTDFQEVTHAQTEEIHEHLKRQDQKIDEILRILRGGTYENN